MAIKRKQPGMAGMTSREMDRPMPMPMPMKINVIKRKGATHVPVRKMPARQPRMGSQGIYV